VAELQIKVANLAFLKPEFETPLAFLEIKKTDKIWLF